MGSLEIDNVDRWSVSCFKLSSVHLLFVPCMLRELLKGDLVNEFFFFLFFPLGQYIMKEDRGISISKENMLLQGLRWIVNFSISFNEISTCCVQQFSKKGKKKCTMEVVMLV